MKVIPNALSTKLARVALQSQKASPQLLFVGGLVGMGATIVLACKATLQVDEILLDHETELSKIDEAYSISHAAGWNGSVLTESEAKHAKGKLIVVTGARLGKVYAPAIITGTFAVVALTGSHNILTKRNAALTAAYGTISKAFEDYRRRVQDELGTEREQEIYHDVRPCEIEDEKGKKTVAKKANGAAPYSFLFDETNPNWSPTPEYNFLFLKLQQKFANDRLQARGHLFLNEVLTDLGLEHTKAGAVTGWIKGQGDDYVDFGIFADRMEERIVEFMVGREKALWLNFNVDGTIFDKI